MERKLSTKKYIAAFIITLIVFSLGFILGIIIDKVRSSYVSTVLTQQKVESDSIQLQYLYLTTQNTTGNCPAIREILNTNLKSLSRSLSRLISYKDRAVYKQEDFILTHRQYILEEIKYWTLAGEIKKSCNEDFVRVLFFFSENCDDCDPQSFILDYYKKLLEDKLLVFTFDTRLEAEEPLLKTLMTQYNITIYPSIVVETTKYGGLKDTEALKEIICNNYEKKPEGC